jgi:hypothetical protein
MFTQFKFDPSRFFVRVHHNTEQIKHKYEVFIFIILAAVGQVLSEICNSLSSFYLLRIN